MTRRWAPVVVSTGGVRLAMAGCVLAAVTVTLAAASGEERTLAGAAERVRAAKIKDAALRSIDASVASLAELLADVEAHAVDMLADPARHRVRSESRRIVRAKEHDRLRGAFRKQLVAFAENRGADLPDGWVDDVMTQERSRVDATVDRLLNERFEKLYDGARRRAVRVQRGHLEEIVYPESEDIEALAGPPDEFVRIPARDIAGYVTTANGRMLVEDHVAAIAADGTLFEENEAILEEQQREAVRDALVLLWRQLRLVGRSEPDGAPERSAIAARIMTDLKQLATEAEEVSGTSYGVFPSAESFAVQRAEKLEVRGFKTFIKEQLDPSAACPALPEQRVLRDAESSFDRVPAERASHERRLRQSLFGSTAEYLVEAYARLLDDVAARAEFRERLRNMLQTEASAERLLDLGFTNCLPNPLREHRDKLAVQELAARLPTVADFSFELTDPALRALESSPLDALDASPLPGPDQLHMEESRARYDSHRQQLIDEARNVLWRQKALTRNPDRKRSFVEQIEADTDRSEERKAFWHQAYERNLLDAWREVRREELLKRGDGEPYRADKYDRVLGPISEMIEEIITLEFGRSMHAGGSGSATDTAGAGASGTRESEGQASQSTAGAGQSPGAEMGPDGAGGSSEVPGPLASGPQETERGGSAGAGGQSSGSQGSGGGGAGAGSSGSGGAGVDCTPLLERCNSANAVCYDALVGCKKDPATCNAGITRCHAAKELCERLWRDSSALEARAQQHRHHPWDRPRPYPIRSVSSQLRSVSDGIRSPRYDLSVELPLRHNAR